jgi:DNA-binding NarL/FixJ family response regulator
VSGSLAAALLTRSDDARQVDGLAIVADRQLCVAALAALLLRDGRYALVRAARGTADVTQALETFRPAVLVVEISRSQWSVPIDPRAWGGRTLVLLDPDGDPDAFVRAARAGVHGYLSRSAPSAALVAAVDTLRSTGYCLDSLLGERIIAALRQDGSSAPQRSDLSQRERGVLTGVASGKSSKQIAREFAITPKTVSNHVANIYEKLHLRHRGELVLYAAEQGLVTAF